MQQIFADSLSRFEVWMFAAQEGQMDTRTCHYCLSRLGRPSLHRGAYFNQGLSEIARRLERKGRAMSPDAYGVATQRIDAEFDIPQYDVSNLIRSIVANRGRLPPDGRNRYRYLPDAVLQRIEAIVCEVFRIETVG